MTPSLCQPVKFICVFYLYFIVNAWRQLEIDFTEKWQAELIDNMWNQENIHIYKNTAHQVIYVFGSLNGFLMEIYWEFSSWPESNKVLQAFTAKSAFGAYLATAAW